MWASFISAMTREKKKKKKKHCRYLNNICRMDGRKQENECIKMLKTGEEVNWLFVIVEKEGREVQIFKLVC